MVQVRWRLCFCTPPCFIELGACLAGKGIEVVYGGGRFGLMGRMADSLLQNGGKITGIIPKFFTG